MDLPLPDQIAGGEALSLKSTGEVLEDLLEPALVGRPGGCDLRLKISGWAEMQRSNAVAWAGRASFEIKSVIVRVLTTAVRPDGCDRVA